MARRIVIEMVEMCAHGRAEPHWTEGISKDGLCAAPKRRLLTSDQFRGLFVEWWRRQNFTGPRNRLADDWAADLANTLLDALMETDEALARRVAAEVGDTFICYDNMAPVEQWARVLRVLAEGGWTLARLDDPQERMNEHT